MVKGMPEKTDLDTTLDIDWLKTLAGALAAVTSAVLLSTLGAVGTMIGAALGSVAATVGTALYAHGLAKSRETVARAQEATLIKVGVAQAEVRRASHRSSDEGAVEAHLGAADERLAEAKVELDDAAGQPVTSTFRERLAGLPWKRIGVTAAGTFLVVVLTITAFELLTGRSVSSRTGGDADSQGTTIGSVTGDGGRSSRDQDGRDRPEQDPSDDATPTEEPSPSPEPSSEPSETPTEAPTAPEVPTPTATVPTPSEPAPVPTPSVSATP